MVEVVTIQVLRPVKTERMEARAYLDGKLELRQLLLAEPQKVATSIKVLTRNSTLIDSEKPDDFLFQAVGEKQRILKT